MTAASASVGSIHATCTRWRCDRAFSMAARALSTLTLHRLAFSGRLPPGRLELRLDVSDSLELNDLRTLAEMRRTILAPQVQVMTTQSGSPSDSSDSRSPQRRCSEKKASRSCRR